MVSGLPPRSRSPSAAAIGRVRPLLDRAARPGRPRPPAAGRLSRSYRASHRLFEVPPMRHAPTAMNEAAADAPLVYRRAALNLLAGAMAAGLAACSRPMEQIVPYVEMPER